MSHDQDFQPVRKSGFPAAVLGLCLVVFVPVVFYGFQGELDRWRAAQSIEQYLDGQREPAIARMQEIVARRPEDQQLRIILARWLLDNQQPQAALQLVDAVPEELRSRALLLAWGDCLQANGRSRESLQVFRELFPANIPRDGSETRQHLNALSYMQALDGSELRMARKNSHQVVSGIARDWNTEFQNDLSVDNQIVLSAVLIYRGNIGMPEPGQEINTREFRSTILDILDLAITQMESEYANAIQLSIPLAIEITKQIFGGGDTATEPSGEGGSADPIVQSAAHGLGTMLTLRALIWQDLGRLDRSFDDRKRVIQLGMDPATVAAKWPPLSVCANQLALLGMTLDTRGCVQYKFKKYQLALEDLNFAIMAQECLVDTSTLSFPGLAIATADLRERRQLVEEQPRKTLAVLLYHRSWIYRDLGLEQEENADIDRVRELGFVPGDHLF